MNAEERHGRKQVLMTRIAFERNELGRELTHVRHAIEPRQLLRALIGDSFGGTIGRMLFGSGSHAGSTASGDLLGQALAWLRRYRVAAALIGSIAPMLRGGGRWRRVLRVAAIAGVAGLSWLAMRKRKP